MKIFDFSFLWVIIAAGFLSLLFMVGNMWGLGMHRYPGEPRRYVNEGDAERGRSALANYGCGSCHVIPGVREANGRVGPSLVGLDKQIYLAGRVANTPANLMLWIMHPEGIDPYSLMPNLGVSEDEARDMAAYLYEQRQNPGVKFWRSTKLLFTEEIP